MGEWLLRNWLALVTVAGAVAAVWTAYETRRLARMQAQSLAPARPLISAQMKPHPRRQGYSIIKIELRNNSDVAFEILEARVLSPRGMRLIPTIVKGSDGGGGSIVDDDLAHAAKRLQLAWEVDEKGGTFLGHPMDSVYKQITAHLPSSDAARSASIRFLVRRKDHAAKTFTIAVNVTTAGTR